MAIFGVGQRDRRVAVADALHFPGGVRHRFAQEHGELTREGLQAVEGAARQWFRLLARHPRVRLAMPSVLVDGLWREFRVHTREYEEFCTAAFGRVVQPAAETRPRDLSATFRFAQQDEPLVSGLLPLLFRVDQQLAASGGRGYLADCGGRGVCYGLKDTICLQHLDGPGKAPGGGRKWNHSGAGHGGGMGPGGGDGGGCGGGCGGGN